MPTLMERLQRLFSGRVCAFDETSFGNHVSGETGEKGGDFSSDYESDAGFDGAPRRADSGGGPGGSTRSAGSRPHQSASPVTQGGESQNLPGMVPHEAESAPPVGVRPRLVPVAAKKLHSFRLPSK